jgi:hypothetical protein
MGYQVTRYFNSVKVHPQMGHNGHPVDGALVGAGSLSTGALGIGLPLVLVGSSGTLHLAPLDVHPHVPWPLVIS